MVILDTLDMKIERLNKTLKSAFYIWTEVKYNPVAAPGLFI